MGEMMIFAQITLASSTKKQTNQPKKKKKPGR